MGWTYTQALRGISAPTSSKPVKKRTATPSKPAPKPTPKPTIPKPKLPTTPVKSGVPSQKSSSSDTPTTASTISKPIPNPATTALLARDSPKSVTANRSIPSTNNSSSTAASVTATLSDKTKRKGVIIPSFNELKSRPDLPPQQSKTPSLSVSAESTKKSASGKKKQPTAAKSTKTNETAESIALTDAEKNIPTEKKTKRTTNSTAKTPAKATPNKSNKTGVKRSIDADEDGSRKRPTKTSRKQKQLPILDKPFSLKYIIKGHTEVNLPVRAHDELEVSKDIWCCEFEPFKEGKSEMVAICGSYSVLLLDTIQGRYVKKYTHSENQEIFYCMAWTTLQGEQLLNINVNEEDESCNILAVAGRLGSIKLLNPLQGECYRYLFGHRSTVLALAFAKAEPRWLFSASADHTVRLWDIGSPTSKMDDSACLAKFNLPLKAGIPSTVSVSYDLSTVMVGCDNGDMIRFKIPKQQLASFRKNSEKYREKEVDSGDKWSRIGPIATINPTMFYPEGDEWHEGYIDDICILGQDGDSKNKLSGRIVSRGASDMEIIIWNPTKSTVKDAEIDTSLSWPDSADCTGLRFKVIEQQEQKVLLAGEYEGQICIYNIGNGQKSKTLADNSKEQLDPSKILSNPSSSEVIRDVTCSNDTSTIVAVDSNNTVFVWTSSS